MTAGLVVVAASDLVVAAVLLVTTLRAADGRMGVNGLAGIRTGATTASTAAWRAAHRAALPLVRWTSWGFVAAALVGLAMWPLGLPDVGFGVAFAPNVLVLGVLWPLVATANRAAREAEDGRP